MMPYLVHFHVDRPPAFAPLQLLVRVLAFCVIGVFGLSFGSIFAFGYFALPVFAAIRIAGRDGATYGAEDGPRIARALHWLAAAFAWAGLTSDQLPSRAPSETVTVAIEGTTTRPTAASALWRIVTGIPSALVFYVLAAIGVLVWLWAALSILFTHRIGDTAFQYLAGLQRWSIRLLAYQASIVDEYPPFSFADTEPHVPSRAVPAV